MTICIAATCEEPEDKPCIVLCRDWRGEVPSVGSNDELLKLRRLSDKWVALIANNISRAEELCLRIEYSLKSTPFTEQNIAQELRKIFGEHKRAMADTFLRNKYGFSLDTLLDKGKGAFGEDFVAGCFDEISKLSVSADLIVAGFVEAYDYDEGLAVLVPIICSVSEANDGDPVVLEYEFSVIGSGGSVARSMMFSRQQSSDNDLMQTIYTVYEAKLISETVPGVGDSFSIDMLRPDGSLQMLSDTGVKQCKELFKRFGRRSIYVKTTKDWFQFEEKFFEPWSNLK
jgi:hypothetical protein